MAHAEFSASGSSRWLNCPGSIRLARVLPRSKSSVFAMEGTAAHALGEACLRTNSKTCNSFKGYYIEVNEGQEPKFFVSQRPLENPPKNVFLVDEDMMDAVNIYLETVEQYKAELGENTESLIEQRLDLGWIRPNMFGTGDFTLAKWLDHLVIIDYKHGKGVGVEAVNNPQLKYYALGAAKLFDFQFEKVTMVVVQPRYHHSEGPVRSHTMSMEELLRFADELAAGVDRALEDDSMLSPGSHCKFCPALGVPPGAEGHCEASWNKVEETAVADFSSAPPIEAEGEIIPLPSTPEQFAKALMWIPLIDSWCKRVASEAENRALNGETIPGFKLVQKRTNRKWSDFASEEDIVKELGEQFELPPEQLYAPPKLLTPPAVEKFLKAAQKRALAATGLVVKPEGSLTLVDAADPREGVVPKLQAAADFEEAPPA